MLDSVEVLGFRGCIDSVADTLRDVNSFKGDGEIIQLLNADSIVSERHVVHGVNQAFLAFERGENLAKDIGVEIVLRCSAQRQISRAFDILGLREGDMNLCAVLVNSGDHFDDLSSMFSPDMGVLNPDFNYLMDVYGIGDVEVQRMSVEDIVIDRITKLIVDY